MADFLTTTATSSCIEEIIRQASSEVVLVSPYIRWSPIVFERLREADRGGITITCVHGKGGLQPEQAQMMGALNRLQIYYHEHLHAKCYFNERQLIVSSMNLYEFSERTNREMSLRVFASEQAYVDAVTEARSIIAAARRELRPVPTGRLEGGYCIRCGRPISRDRERPFCLECFDIWAQWENWDFEEKYCHACGTDAETSRRYPICDGCFRQSS